MLTAERTSPRPLALGCGRDDVASRIGASASCVRRTSILAAQSSLLAIAPGPASILMSSCHKSWRGILIEKHSLLPGERGPASTTVDVVALFRGRPARIAYRSARDSWTESIVRADSMAISPTGNIPEVRLHTPAEVVYAALDADFVRGVAEEMEHPCNAREFRVGLRDRSMQQILLLLMNDLESDSGLGGIYIDSLAHALATRYLSLQGIAARQTKATESALPQRLVNRVHATIEANLHSDLRLASLAEECGYSRAHFSRMFRKATGLTPHQYVLELRLQHAQDHLRSSRMNLIDIAAICGFSGQSHMTTVFRNKLQITPAEYRRSIGSGARQS